MEFQVGKVFKFAIQKREPSSTPNYFFKIMSKLTNLLKIYSLKKPLIFNNTRKIIIKKPYKKQQLPKSQWKKYFVY